ncbi:MAG TPA: hypothetical protein PLD55_04445 [bacterium]|nr:hypothetical protein [bacterium]
MRRYEHTEIELDPKKLAKIDSDNLWQGIFDREIEIVYGKKGLKAWCKGNGEDLAINLFKAGKCDITKNFPVRYAEDNGKLITVTKENVKNYETLTKEIPEKFKQEIEK